ncbi:hypothetical protein ACIRS1_19450 [Kitasatospora sp. NPDC101176]|uniref:hypothetical protein n=1 Tax=Kitasatospora sp. NPDC101176 TaxID=3364099 RepID=UPI00382EDF38
MATSQRPVGTWRTAVVAGAAALAVTGGIAAPAGAAPATSSAADRVGIANEVRFGDVQLGEPAHPRDHPGGRPLIKHYWVAKLGYAAVSALNQRTNFGWQRNYKDWTVAIVGNDIQGKRVTVYTKITNLYYGEGGVIGAQTAPTQQVLIAQNTIKAQSVDVVTEIVNVHVISPKWEDVFSADCRAQEDLRNAVKAQLACTMG